MQTASEQPLEGETQPRLDIALLETDVGDSPLRAHLLSNPERRVSQIDTHALAAHRRKRHRDVPRSRRDFQHARIALRRNQLDQLAQMLGVADHGRNRVVIRLSGELFADQIFVFHSFQRTVDHCRVFSERIKRATCLLVAFPSACTFESLNGT